MKLKENATTSSDEKVKESFLNWFVEGDLLLLLTDFQKNGFASH
jgi:hypothetical protein